MKPQALCGAIPLERRKQLLKGIAGFGAMPPKLLTQLAENLREEHFPLGSVVVAEGEVGDRLFFIEDGEAEVSTAGARAAVSLAILARGDMFGEIALLVPARRRQATVTALTPLSTLSLSATAFHQALEVCPDARFDLAAVADTLLAAKFLKQQGSWRG